jgi:hypothetical protein
MRPQLIWPNLTRPFVSRLHLTRHNLTRHNLKQHNLTRQFLPVGIYAWYHNQFVSLQQGPIFPWDFLPHFCLNGGWVLYGVFTSKLQICEIFSHFSFIGPYSKYKGVCFRRIWCIVSRIDHLETFDIFNYTRSWSSLTLDDIIASFHDVCDIWNIILIVCSHITHIITIDEGEMFRCWGNRNYIDVFSLHDSHNIGL